MGDRKEFRVGDKVALQLFDTDCGQLRPYHGWSKLINANTWREAVGTVVRECAGSIVVWWEVMGKTSDDFYCHPDELVLIPGSVSMFKSDN